MHVREFMNRHPGAALAAVVVVLAVSIVIGTRSGQSAPRNAAFFYDLGDGRLFVGTSNDMPPVQAPVGGPAKGVRAYVYSCAQCDESDRFVGYVQTFTDEARAAQADDVLSMQALAAIQKGTLVALPPQTNSAESKWVVSGSPQGQRIMAASQTRCDGQPAMQCYP